MIGEPAASGGRARLETDLVAEHLDLAGQSARMGHGLARLGVTEASAQPPELGTLTRNRVLVDGATEEAADEILAEPTPLQARALELASVSPLAK